MRLEKGLVLALFFSFILASLFFVHGVGNPSATLMDDYFLGNGQSETGSNNIVASVVFDYRGLDTLGEASVLFAAATGVFLILGGGARKNE